MNAKLGLTALALLFASIVLGLASLAQALQPGSVFEDCPDCPEMVVVPAGSYLMGSPEPEPAAGAEEGSPQALAGSSARGEDEIPKHKVTFKAAFAVGKYEVTVEEFEAFVKATNHPVGEKCNQWIGRKWKNGEAGSFRSPGFAQVATQPVVCVSWDEAKAYVAWLSQLTGKGYRLLSEAEWEYVRTGGDEDGLLIRR